jgi:tRNA threonylcarbamoyladenosine biosynthesis protein TsaB
MRVLALDTTTRAGSMAVVEDDRIVAERAGDPVRSHAERLPGDVLDVLKSVALPLSSIDLFAVAVGPGSFTGLRIGIATMQGLAFVSGRRIAPVSALEALAQTQAAGLPPGTVVGAWMDAHRHDVFSALYRIREGPPFSAGRLEELDAPAVGDPAATLRRWHPHVPAIIIGDGAVAHAGVIGPSVSVRAAPVLAGTIGLMAAFAAAGGGGTIDPGAVQPLYVRRPDAEIARERELGAR